MCIVAKQKQKQRISNAIEAGAAQASTRRKHRAAICASFSAITNQSDQAELTQHSEPSPRRITGCRRRRDRGRPAAGHRLRHSMRNRGANAQCSAALSTHQSGGGGGGISKPATSTCRRNIMTRALVIIAARHSFVAPFMRRRKYAAAWPLLTEHR